MAFPGLGLADARCALYTERAVQAVLEKNHGKRIRMHLKALREADCPGIVRLGLSIDGVLAYVVDDARRQRDQENADRDVRFFFDAIDQQLDAFGGHTRGQILAEADRLTAAGHDPRVTIILTALHGAMEQFGPGDRLGAVAYRIRALYERRSGRRSQASIFQKEAIALGRADAFPSEGEIGADETGEAASEETVSAVAVDLVSLAYFHQEVGNFDKAARLAGKVEWESTGVYQPLVGLQAGLTFWLGQYLSSPSRSTWDRIVALAHRFENYWDDSGTSHEIAFHVAATLARVGAALEARTMLATANALMERDLKARAALYDGKSDQEKLEILFSDDEQGLNAVKRTIAQVGDRQDELLAAIVAGSLKVMNLVSDLLAACTAARVAELTGRPADAESHYVECGTVIEKKVLQWAKEQAANRDYLDTLLKGNDGLNSRLFSWYYAHQRDFAEAFRYMEITVAVASEERRGQYVLRDRVGLLGRFRADYIALARLAGEWANEEPGERSRAAVRKSIELFKARHLKDTIGTDAATATLSKTDLALTYGPGTVLLDFLYLGDAVLVWALGADGVETARLIEVGAGFAEKLSRLASGLSSARSSARLLERLSREIGGALLEPLADSVGLPKAKQVVVSPAGPINAVPFGFLSLYRDRFQPLIDSAAVWIAPSLGVVEHLANRGAGPGDRFLGVGDPVYQKGQVKAAAATRGSLTEDTLRAIQGRGYFAPLPETREEIESIGGLFQGGAADYWVGEEAAESVLKRASLTGYRFLHFATHGILGGDVEGLHEPALVLSEETGEDSLLTASEAETLVLDAEMTVLSACNTGSGENVAGEGVLGMSRAFLLAGSRSVVVSLWPVASEPTVDLMVLFYRNIARGEDKGAALRGAMLTMRQKFPHPVYWAPFVISGTAHQGLSQQKESVRRAPRAPVRSRN